MVRKKVVVLGGGTGTSTLLCGLKRMPIDITAVISVSDNGSSTGKLRKEFLIPAVGDIRKVLSNLSTLPDEIRDVMEYRLKSTSNLNGHALECVQTYFITNRRATGTPIFFRFIIESFEDWYNISKFAIILK